MRGQPPTSYEAVSDQPATGNGAGTDEGSAVNLQDSTGSRIWCPDEIPLKPIKFNDQLTEGDNCKRPYQCFAFEKENFLTTSFVSSREQCMSQFEHITNSVNLLGEGNSMLGCWTVQFVLHEHELFGKYKISNFLIEFNIDWPGL